MDASAVFYGNTTAFYYPNYEWLLSDLPKQKQNPIIILGDKPEDTAGLPVFSYDEVNQAMLSNLSHPQPSGGTMLNETVGTNEYRARFVANRESYLMLKTNYHPGRVVTLDGNKEQPSCSPQDLSALRLSRELTRLPSCTNRPPTGSPSLLWGF